ncbi:MAG TPA: hypothetical protein VGQ75_08580 [Thermoanaerobaculia bacterium]|nr:hypothetical protein [Thermoanaerobaculia bacterium]
MAASATSARESTAESSWSGGRFAAGEGGEELETDTAEDTEEVESDLVEMSDDEDEELPGGASPPVEDEESEW